MRLLPVGSEGIVEKIIELGPMKFIQISQHILERIPKSVDLADVLDSEKRERLFGNLQIDPASELTVFFVDFQFTISELWKNIAYCQPKFQSLLESLKEVGFDAEMRNAIVKVWSESGWTVSDRLRNISFSGRPNVKDVEWTLRMNVASSNNPAMRVAEAIVQFETDRGSKIVELSRGKLVELYITLQEVQKSLDVLLER
uniref:COMM domain-containing protein n=1 Tax=Elaeophora elaphi TaxID=1147741 RepID=A0A0R3RHH9_9BILA